jgi:FkbM family methyltransferase
MRMNRRTFLPWFTGGISTSFLVGTAGGIGVGSAGAAVGIAASRPWTRESHSQQGEDLIIESMCDFLKITNPSYLDVGAADPIQDNNTYLFYQKECRGVLVEPNPSFSRRLEDARPGDKVLNIGVGVSDQSEADYYMIGGRDGQYLNSFSKSQVDDIVSRSDGLRFIAKTIKMPLVNINKIMAEQFKGAPSLLFIDTEGLDLDILKTLDFTRFRPAIVCVETLKIGTTRCQTEILELMEAKDYVVRGGTFVNTIFVDDHLLRTNGTLSTS